MNYYAKAIDIISTKDTDFRTLIIEIAKRRPKVVVDAAKQQPLSPLEQEVIPFIKAEKKIEAIKHWRERTGDGLKEAKEAIETLIMKIEL